MRLRPMISALILMMCPALALASGADLAQITQDLNRSVWIVGQTPKAGVLMQVQPQEAHLQAPATRFGPSRVAPLCLASERPNGPLWIGVAHAARIKDGEPIQVYCFINGPEARDDYPPRAHALLKPATGRAYGWIDWGTHRPPAASIGPALVHTQANGRKLFACYAQDTVAGRSVEVVGYVGDDQRCHGVALDRVQAGQFAVGRGTGARQSWLVKQIGARKGYDRYKLYAPIRDNPGDKA